MPPSSPAKPAKTVQYDTPAVKRLVQGCIDAVRNDPARLERDKQDWLNLLFYRGGPDNQWVTYDGQSNIWRPVPTDDSEYGLPPEVPRSASNVFKRKIDGISAILNQSEPAQEWRPSKDDDQSRAAAEVVQDALPVLLDECDYPRVRELINLHCVLTDKVAFEVYYDPDERYGTETIGAVQCQGCGWQGMPMDVDEAGDRCPGCGADGDQMGPMLNQQAQPMGVEYPKGRLRSRLYPSFEVSLPPNARECDERTVQYIVTHSQMPREQVIRMFSDKAKELRNAKGETSAGNMSVQYAAALRNLSSPTSAQRGVAQGVQDSLTVWRVVHDPIETEDGDKFPDGLDVVMVDGEIIDGGPLPIKDDDGQPMKPILLRSFQLTPGSPFGIPPADDLTVLQRQRNLLETLLTLILLHHASPTVYIPTTVTLEDEPTGIPGQHVRYRGNLPGDKPFVQAGTNPPEGLYRAIEMNDAAFDAISGLNAVLEGQSPQGQPTLGEVQILREHGMATFNSPLHLLIDFEKRLSYLVLQVARQSLWTSRHIRKVTDGGDWEIKEFMSADLHGSVDCYVNTASAWPKSQLLQELRMKDAIALGVLNPQDPEVQEKILSAYDLIEMKTSLDADRKQLARELDRWREATSPDQIAPPGEYINVAFHVFQKSQWMKTEEAELIQQANPPVWQAMNQHILLLKQRQMMETMGPAPGGPPGGPGGPPGPGQPPGGKSLEELVSNGTLKPVGPTKSPLEDMVKGGQLKPGQAPAPQSPLEGMIQGGQLTPGQASMPAGPTGPSIDQLRGDSD
jgi:hypothetical protein